MANKVLYLEGNDSENMNNIFFLDQPIHGKYKLKSFVCTNNIYNINEINNIIYVNENSIEGTITLTNGFYNKSDFVTMLTSILNSNMAGTVTVQIDDNTNKLTITNTLNFYFTFGTNRTNSAYKLLGFNQENGTNNTTQSSDNPIDLNTYKNIFLNICENDDKNIVGQNYFQSSLIINGIGSFGDILRYVNQANFDQYVKFDKIKRLEVRFHDSKNNNINLNSDFEIYLEKM